MKFIGEKKGKKMTVKKPDGYLAEAKKGKGSGILVLHAWWGLNETIKAFCDRLAQEGYTVFAPDLYHGKVVKTIPEAEKMVKVLNRRGEEGEKEVMDAARYLADISGNRDGMAVIGFSLGAYYALELSNSNPENIRKVVVFYGTGAEDFSKSKAVYLGHFAENDPYEGKESVDYLKETLKKAGRSATFYTYPGTGHWFFESDRKDAYNETAARQAWERTLAFLKENN
jgi:carboxymethylenebutenolidase